MRSRRRAGTVALVQTEDDQADAVHLSVCAHLGQIQLREPPDAVDGCEDVDTDRVASLHLDLPDNATVEIERQNGNALLRRTGLPDRTLPLVARPLGEELAEELRRLDADQPYAAALAAATDMSGLDERTPTRVHVWKDPALAERPETANAPARATS